MSKKEKTFVTILVLIVLGAAAYHYVSSETLKGFLGIRKSVGPGMQQEEITEEATQ
ncbi:MAG: hypothetical protein V1679_02855 [Candidatus Peregrinibacteria bacterium]